MSNKRNADDFERKNDRLQEEFKGSPAKMVLTFIKLQRNFSLKTYSKHGELGPNTDDSCWK